MTAAQLLAYITVALLLQLAAGVVWALWQRGSVPGASAPEANSDADSDVQPASPGSQGAWPGWRDFRVVRRAFEDAAQSQCSFYLQPVDGAPLTPFQPGQYLTFSLKLPADRTLTRCYSLSDRPDPSGYRITIKRALPPPGQPTLPPGLSSNHFHDRVHEGDVIQVRAPAGQFFIDRDPSVPAVLVAGGIGITPMMSMLRWCLAEQPDRLVHLYYGVRNRADHAFKQVLEDLAARHPTLSLNVVYSDPGGDDLLARDYQHVGHVDVALLRRTLPHGRQQFYVCGPPAMMQSLVPALRDWGVQPGDLHHEAFGPASGRPTSVVSNEPATARGAAIEVRFGRSGRTLSWDGRDANLLDFAERNGLAVDSGCRSGSCGACQTRLLSGVVTYADKPDHEIPKGHCLLCVCKPQSALVLDT